MKYYSDVTRKLYETQEELLAAEFAENEKKQKEEALKKEKEAREKDIEKKFEDLVDQMKKFYDDYHCLPSFSISKDFGNWRYKYFSI